MIKVLAVLIVLKFGKPELVLNAGNDTLTCGFDTVGLNPILSEVAPYEIVWTPSVEISDTSILSQSSIQQIQQPTILMF